jgi:hypothetical protein
MLPPCALHGGDPPPETSLENLLPILQQIAKKGKPLPILAESGFGGRPVRSGPEA